MRELTVHERFYLNYQLTEREKEVNEILTGPLSDTSRIHYEQELQTITGLKDICKIEC